MAEMPDGVAILDVPCGGGIAKLRLRPDQRVRGIAVVDISTPMLHRARRRVPTVHRDRVEIIDGSIERMPFDGGEFDLCVCSTGATATDTTLQQTRLAQSPQYDDESPDPGCDALQMAVAHIFSLAAYRLPVP
jgi:ubiquinone/menaquinone biosynthesis C-methylase UbiE